MSSNTPEIATPAQGSSLLKRFVIVALVIFLAVIVLAEFGVLSLHSSSSNSSSEHNYETNRHTVNHRVVLLSGFRLVPQVTVREAGPGKPIAEEAAKSLRKVAAGQTSDENTKFTITIESVTTEGAPWLPLYRTCTSRFNASYELEAFAAGSSIRVRGKIHGKVEQSIKGLSSLSLFRASMGRDIAAAVTNDIQRMIAKNGS